VEGVIDASTSELGAFHEEVRHRIEAIAASRERRDQHIEESTEEGKPPTDDDEDQEPNETKADTASTRHDVRWTEDCRPDCPD